MLQRILPLTLLSLLPLYAMEGNPQDNQPLDHINITISTKDITNTSSQTEIHEITQQLNISSTNITSEPTPIIETSGAITVSYTPRSQPFQTRCWNFTKDLFACVSVFALGFSVLGIVLLKKSGRI